MEPAEPLQPAIEDELIMNEDLNTVTIRIKETIKVQQSLGHH
jgi:hypothetical protein